jgi:hypothetical protein
MMAEGVDNLVLEQRRLIRSDLARIEEKFDGRINDLEAKVDGNTGVLVALGRYIHDSDGRVERLEEAIGART